MVISKNSVLGGLGILQHTRAGWKFHHELRCHTNVVLDVNDLKEAVSFAYNTHLDKWLDWWSWRPVKVGKTKKKVVI